MRTIKPKSTCLRLSAKTETLLLELGEECRRTLKLLAQLDAPTLTGSRREAVLGELSAAILHLHQHTRGLDSLVDSEG